MGKGILLLHDIQARTAAALPKILQDMKARGYKIVHVVAATPDLPATPTEPEQWQMHPPSEDKAIARWPKLPNFIYADSDMLAAPAASNFDLAEGGISLALDRKRGSAKETPWPRVDALQVVAAAASLPAPAEGVFDVPEKARAWIQPFPVQMHHYAEGETPPGGVKVASTAEPRGRHGRGRARVAARQLRHVAHAAAASAKPATKQAAARPAAGAAKRTRVAALKKRKI
jgi:hypothetical protein